MIGEQQTPQRILEARERLYELIAHCIPAEIIFKVNHFLYYIITKFLF